MQFSTQRISIVSSLENRWLEAYYDHAFLWSKPVTQPGSTDEVAGFYAVTLIRFNEVLEPLSAHQRMELLLRTRAQRGLRKARHGEAFLEDLPYAE